MYNIQIISYQNRQFYLLFVQYRIIQINVMNSITFFKLGIIFYVVVIVLRHFLRLYKIIYILVTYFVVASFILITFNNNNYYYYNNKHNFRLTFLIRSRRGKA